MFFHSINYVCIIDVWLKHHFKDLYKKADLSIQSEREIWSDDPKCEKRLTRLYRGHQKGFIK